ncbi:hypothetical protein CFIMG_005035RAa [Ceratocystis fimbriata CBS 114723]|uniref:DUF1996 domain-containing protein n=1 Tax=Ceratocystis fimbriata CBS 114723 TaxID=1035309 RepID=A0A2C5WZ05_9PEZI|nr:hypothetical protein CFIMG_005035RAa [Ceratocystis fimbriata CBS 114723]
MKPSLLALASSLGLASAFWRMECPSRVGNARLDPIVNPGGISAHMHSIYGSSGFSKTSDFGELHGAECTSCRVTQDKSAYWTPSLYFQDTATGEFTEVDEQGGLLAYYFLNHDKMTAFPEGFRMLAGTNSRRSFTTGNPMEGDPPKSSWAAEGITSQKALAERAIGFNCLNYAKQGEATLSRHYLPEKSWLDANCPDGIRIELMFPSCWNGKDLDSADHQSHVAYPDLVMTGECPDTHPVGLAGIMFETFFRTQEFAGKAGRFVVANGDPTGYGFHGDFITGWTPSVLQQAIDTCTSGSGLIDDCPVFNVVSKSESSKCKLDRIETAAISSPGPLQALPGNVAVVDANGFSGSSGSGSGTQPSSSLPLAAPPPAAHPPSSSSSSSPPPPPPLPVTPTSTSKSTPRPAPSSSSSRYGSAGMSIAAVPNHTTSPPSTTTISTSSVDPDAGKFYSTQWSTDSRGTVYKILWLVVYVTEIKWVDAMPTATFTSVTTSKPAQYT